MSDRSALPIVDARSSGASEDGCFRVIFVCTGNICRSAFAAAYTRKILSTSTSISVESAGIMAASGHSMDVHMRLQARVHGADGEGHLAHQLTGRDLRGAGLVLGFGREHLGWVAECHPEYLGRVLLLGQAARALRQQPARALSRWRTLADDVRAIAPEPSGTDEIEDPYGRGDAEAARVAERICLDVDVLCARLGEVA